jgi:hypothetical protein
VYSTLLYVIDKLSHWLSKDIFYDNGGDDVVAAAVVMVRMMLIMVIPRMIDC